MVPFTGMYFSHVIEFSPHPELDRFGLYVLQFLDNPFTSGLVRIWLV